MSMHHVTPPTAEQNADLDAVAERMVAEATSTTSPRIFSASGFARENISIVHQQIRCTNLAWALKQTGRVGVGDVVGVVGGSFSGLMLAVALALGSGAIVYVFEKESALFPRFRHKAHRHLSPVLNSRFLGKRFGAASATPEFRRPIFAWEKGRASDVASQWMNEFLDYDARLPIFVFRNAEVSRDNVASTAAGVRVSILGQPQLQPLHLDFLVDATGFGEEDNPLKVVDCSYWDGGHRLTYDHLLSPAEVLVSGCGDSGVIEGLHYALRDFLHEEVEALWPEFQGYEAAIDEGVARARLHDIFKRSEAETLQVVSEICWWASVRANLIRNPHHDWLGAEPHVRPIFDLIDTVMRPAVAKAFPGQEIETIEGEALEVFLEDVEPELQLAVRKAVRRTADHWISLRLERFANELDLPLFVQDLQAQQRIGVRVVMNGLTPTAYTRQLSPYNVWLMRVLLSLPSVSYRQGRIAKVTAGRRDFRVTFDAGKAETFDRVVTRYGAGGASGVAVGTSRDTEPGDCLLEQPIYLAHNPSSGSGRYVAPARQAIVDGLEALDARTPLASTWDISKARYIARMVTGRNGFPPGDDLYEDPQQRLSSDLRNGVWPSFEWDRTVNKAMKL